MKKLIFIMAIALFVNVVSAVAQVPDDIEKYFRTSDFVFMNKYDNKVDQLESLIEQLTEEYNKGNYESAMRIVDRILTLAPDNKIAIDMRKKIEDEKIRKSEAYRISLNLKIQELLRDADKFAQQGDIDTALEYLIQVIEMEPSNKQAVEKFMNLVYENFDKKIEKMKLSKIETRARKLAKQLQADMLKKVKELQNKPDIIKNIELKVRPGERFMIMLDTTEAIKDNWEYYISDTSAIVFLQKSYFPPIDKSSLGKLIYQFESEKEGVYEITFRTKGMKWRPKAIVYRIKSTGSEAAQISKQKLKESPPKKPVETKLETEAKLFVKKPQKIEATSMELATDVTSGRLEYLVTLYNLKLYDEAIAAARDIITSEQTKEEDKFKAYTILARSYFANGDTDAAISTYELIREEASGTKASQEALLELGNIYFKLGQLRNAIRYYIEAKAMPFSKEIVARAMYNIGNIFEAMSPPQLQEALNEYEKLALKYKNTDYGLKALKRIAEIYDYKMHDYYNAYKYYKSLIEQYPQYERISDIKRRLKFLENTYL